MHGLTDVTASVTSAPWAHGKAAGAVADRWVHVKKAGLTGPVMWAPVTAAARNRNRGPLAQGILTMVVFGLAWALAATVGLPPGARIAAWAAALVLAVVVAGAALRSRPARTVRRGRTTANPGRDFGWVNLAQTLLIVVAVVGLVRAGHPVLIAPVTCAVVGLHFLPLARIFGIVLYLWTGALLIVVAAIGFFLVAGGVSTGAGLAAIGLPAAVILWATSLQLPRYG